MGKGRVASSILAERSLWRKGKRTQLSDLWLIIGKFKVLFDNQVFQYIHFYGHTYKWDEEKVTFFRILLSSLI